MRDLNEPVKNSFRLFIQIVIVVWVKPAQTLRVHLGISRDQNASSAIDQSYAPFITRTSSRILLKRPWKIQTLAIRMPGSLDLRVLGFMAIPSS